MFCTKTQCLNTLIALPWPTETCRIDLMGSALPSAAYICCLGRFKLRLLCSTSTVSDRSGHPRCHSLTGCAVHRLEMVKPAGFFSAVSDPLSL